MKTLSGKAVLITGAASGIGLECARAFADAGAGLYLTDVNERALRQCAREFLDRGVRCHVRGCDVSSAQAVAELAEAVQAVVGTPDVLVNNAGIGYIGGFENTPLEHWQRALDINVMGVVHCIQAFLPPMKAAGGERKIVNVASLAGVAPPPNMSAYAASKFAVVGLSEVLALELHETEVSVLVVCPGIINTPIVRAEGVAGPGITEAQMDTLKRYYVQHGCLPDVVARGVVRSVLRDDPYLFVGPMAKPGSLLARVSRQLARKVTLRGAREIGYLA
jgi:NAD(P)-dependent dehydrogenase (short-subunit alcohol dehydrogenase family)